MENSKEAPYYQADSDEVYLDKTSPPYVAKKNYVHELGHKFHYEKGIITDEKVEPKFKAIFDGFKEEFNSLPESKKELLKKANYKSSREKLIKLNPNLKHITSNFTDVTDIVCALTGGEYGYGHPKSYMKYKNNSYMEVFAHGHETYWMKNQILTAFFPKSSKVLLSYFKDIFNE